MDEALKTVRVQVSAHRFAQRQRKQAQADQVVKWTDESGADVCNQLVSAFPSLRGDLRSLQARPMSPDLAWVRAISPAVELIPRLIAFKRDEDQMSVLKEVKDRWLDRHRTIEHDHVAPLVDPPAHRGKNKTQLCGCQPLLVRSDGGLRVGAARTSRYPALEEHEDSWCQGQGA